MDPLTLAAVTGGFAAVKSAISGVRSALESADDVGAIAGHIDTLFKTHGAAKKRIKEAEKKKLPKNKWAKFVKLTLKSDDNDETSLANVAAAKLAEKQQEEDIRKLSLQIDKRFGPGTWGEILEAQEQAKVERRKRLKREAEERAEAKLQGRTFWQKVLIETGKVIFVILFIAGMIAFIWHNKV
tara:strand:- start:144 stop:695 length:552 start_codon:yes stop_codon:yes gene_type:complete